MMSGAGEPGIKSAHKEYENMAPTSGANKGFKASGPTTTATISTRKGTAYENQSVKGVISFRSQSSRCDDVFASDNLQDRFGRPFYITDINSFDKTRGRLDLGNVSFGMGPTRDQVHPTRSIA